MVAEFDAANLATIATVKWPGSNPQFKGTDTLEALAAAAIEFLRNQAKWSKPEYDDEHIPYIAVVRGSAWEVNTSGGDAADPAGSAREDEARGGRGRGPCRAIACC